MGKLAQHKGGLAAEVAFLAQDPGPGGVGNFRIGVVLHGLFERGVKLPYRGGQAPVKLASGS